VRKIALALVSMLMVVSGVPSNATALSCACIRFAYDASNSGNTYGGCPINAEKLALTWKTKIGEYGESRNNSNVICDDKKIFVGTESSLKCISAINYKELWSYEVRSKIIATPCVMGNLIYVPVFKGEVICMNKLGKGQYTGNVTGNLYSSPVVYSGKLYVANDKGVLDCINVSSGWEDWWIMANDGFRSTPAFKDKTIILGCMNSYIYGISTVGKQLWAVEDFGPITSSASIAGDRFFIGSDSGTISCRNVSDGSLIWKESLSGKVFSTPATKNNCVFFGSTNSTFYCYGFDGKKKWSFVTGGPIEGSCTLEGNTCYFGSNDGYVYALDQATGKLLWSYKTGGRIQNTPIVAESGLWVYSSDGFLHCFRDDGKVVRPEVAKVEISPTNAECYPGETVTFTASAFTKNNEKIEDAKFVWSCNKKDIGTIDDKGVFKAIKPGLCTISVESDGKSAQAQVNCIEKLFPKKIGIEPENAVAEFGKTIQFVATVIDNKGNILSNPKISWSCNPPELGSIDSQGLFTAGNSQMSGIVIAACENIKAEAKVKVEEPKLAIIRIDNPELVFENIPPGKPASTILIVRNDGNIPDDITVSTNDQWMGIDPGQATIEPKTAAEITITLKPEYLKKNTELSGGITITTSNSSIMTAKVKVKVNSGLDCYKVTDILEFGKVSRGTTKTKTFTIEFDGDQSGKIISKAPWLIITPDVFSHARFVDISVTINGSELPAGENFEDYIELVGNDLCRETKIKVTVGTEKDIRIVLKLNSPIAEMNGRLISLASSPTIIKGSTMVPLRFIGEAFGCKVDWDDILKKITLTRKSLAIVLFLDKKEALVNGGQKTLSAPPVSVKGKTLVPIRFIAETFGAKVDFEAKTGQITIAWIPD
jgi:outer membrane protein assembly factor BamB